MNASEESAQPEQRQAEPASAPSAVPPFNAARLAWQLRLDAMLYVLFAAIVLGAMLLVIAFGGGAAMLGAVPLLLLVIGWIGLHTLSAHASRQLPGIAAITARDPDQAERQLASLLSKHPLLGWVRLMLYHRLAVVRFHQQRFAEAGAICASVLVHRLGPASDARAHLLLLLTEASLETGDLPSAWHALLELGGTPLSLQETLQRLALQTRYELAINQPRCVAAELPRKIALAELLSAPQAGALHAMLATAADRTDQPDRARWLWNRAALLSRPEAFEQYRQGRFGVRIVQPEPDPAINPA